MIFQTDQSWGLCVVLVHITQDAGMVCLGGKSQMELCSLRFQDGLAHRVQRHKTSVRERIRTEGCMVTHDL